MQKFVIFSCGYNCSKYVKKHIESIKNQKYDNYVHVIIDDNSNDDTIKIIEENKHDKLVTYRNYKNSKWVSNALQYLDSHIESDEDVVVIVDMDDWLAHDYVFKKLNEVYTNKKAWMTYSLFKYPNGKDSNWIPKYSFDNFIKRDFRKHIWSFTHLRTFKSFLWQNLNKEDLKGPDGSWTQYTYDMALLFPMLEMCQLNKIKFIKNIMYVYNNENPLQVEKKFKGVQQAMGRWFRSKPKYDRLERK